MSFQGFYGASTGVSSNRNLFRLTQDVLKFPSTIQGDTGFRRTWDKDKYRKPTDIDDDDQPVKKKKKPSMSMFCGFPAWHINDSEYRLLN